MYIYQYNTRVAETVNFLKRQEYRFTLVRDYDRKPYNWETWENGKVIKSEPAEILAFYKIYLNADMDKPYGFEIRKDEVGNEIFDHDDMLTEVLYLQGKSIKEVNDFCGRIFDAMYENTMVNRYKGRSANIRFVKVGLKCNFQR